MAPLRILCIHGYRQNGSSFREKTGALRKLLKKQVELVYMNAPLTVQQGGSFPTPASQTHRTGSWVSFILLMVDTKLAFTFTFFLTLFYNNLQEVRRYYT